MDDREPVKTCNVFETAGAIAGQLLPNGEWEGITTCVQIMYIQMLFSYGSYSVHYKNSLCVTFTFF